MDVVAGRVWADERRPIRHLDPMLLIVTAALVVIGLFAIYSATSQTLRADGFDPFSRVNKQVVTAVLGLVLLLVMATFDYRFLKVYAGFIYGATIVGLLLLRIPGARGERDRHEQLHQHPRRQPAADQPVGVREDRPDRDPARRCSRNCARRCRPCPTSCG